MSVVVPRGQAGYDRKRRAHAKSRKGCGNCKLRRIKCDETRPRCQKCVSYGVACDYDGSKPALDLTAEGTFQVELSQKPETSLAVSPRSPSPFNALLEPQLLSMTSAMSAMVDSALSYTSWDINPEFVNNPSFFNGPEVWHFTDYHVEALSRFQERTIKTVGSHQSVDVYRECICRLAFTHPFLMHMVLSLTFMHDAHLAPSCELAAKHWHRSLQHWNTATTFFNYVLSQPINPESRDAIWAAGALLGTIVFAYVESYEAEKMWPMKPPEPSDLDWLKLSDGKKAIWQVADPTRSDSVFAPLAQNRHCHVTPDFISQNEIPPHREYLKEFFDISPCSTIENNPYHLSILILCRLESIPATFSNILSLLSFMAFITPDYLRAVEAKDPRAVMLLGWWFKKLGTIDLWWVKNRAIVQTQAIRMWLERRGFGELFDVLYMPSGGDSVRIPAVEGISVGDFLYAMMGVD